MIDYLLQASIIGVSRLFASKTRDTPDSTAVSSPARLAHPRANSHPRDPFA